MRAKGMLRWLARLPLLALLQAPGAFAGDYSVGVTGGLSAPFGDFKDPFKSGWTAGGVAEYRGGSAFGLGMDFGYHSWKGKNAFWDAAAQDLGAAPGTHVTAKLTAIRYGVHGTVSLPGERRIRPYARLGIDGYNLKQTTDSNDPSFITDFSKNLAGFNLGVGADWALAPTTGLGLLAQYHNVGSKDEFGANATWIELDAVLTLHAPAEK